MIVKLIYNILDINSNSFDTNLTISAEEYGNMLNDKINENNIILNNFNGESIEKRDLHYTHFNINENNTLNEKYIQIPCEAYLSTYNNDKITINTLEKMVHDGKMVLLKININPNELDYDVYSDLKQWISESNNIKNNNNFNEKEKISILPTRKINIEIDEFGFTFNNVKIIKDESNAKFPFNIVVLIEKITL